jgi:ADP-heptose:LPS heptosyltransferase
VLKRIEKRGKIAIARLAAHAIGARGRFREEILRLEPKRVLVIRQHNQMGDMLLAVPAFRALRRRFPDARISLVAASINGSVMENSPFVDEVLVYAKERNKKNPMELIRFIAQLRSRRFDLVIVLNTVSFSITSMLLAALSGARFRVGSSSSGFGHDLSSRYYHLEMPLPGPEELARMHESEHNLYPLSVIGAAEEDLISLLVPTEEDLAAADRFVRATFPAGEPFIVVHPGAGKKQNVWPPGNFARAVARLAEMRPIGVVAIRGPVDRETFDRFLSACPLVSAVLSTPGVGFLGAVMKRAAVTLCNDTGIMHVAGAVGANCCAVFGPTDPDRWKPLNDNVVAVRSADGAIESVTVDEVVSSAAPFLVDPTRGSA